MTGEGIPGMVLIMFVGGFITVSHLSIMMRLFCETQVLTLSKKTEIRLFIFLISCILMFSFLKEMSCSAAASFQLSAWYKWTFFPDGSKNPKIWRNQGKLGHSSLKLHIAWTFCPGYCLCNVNTACLSASSHASKGHYVSIMTPRKSAENYRECFTPQINILNNIEHSINLASHVLLAEVSQRS